jgi:hypothetical protein
MKRFLILTAAFALLATWGWTHDATAGWGTYRNRAAYYQSQMYPWHGGYYDAAWGVPVALVVPPTAENQTHLSWGVGSSRVNGIPHQFQRSYPGPRYYDRCWFRPTPPWPSSTDQLGDYYIRGPW